MVNPTRQTSSTQRRGISLAQRIAIVRAETKPHTPAFKAAMDDAVGRINEALSPANLKRMFAELEAQKEAIPEFQQFKRERGLS